MKPKPIISLTAHRNTASRRHKRDLATSLARQVKKMTKDADIRAYAIVGIAADGSGHALWDTGAVLPMWAFADVVAGLLRRDIENNIDRIKEDWKPPARHPVASAGNKS
jgi:hypothetical protein